MLQHHRPPRSTRDEPDHWPRESERTAEEADVSRRPNDNDIKNITNALSRSRTIDMKLRHYFKAKGREKIL